MTFYKDYDKVLTKLYAEAKHCDIINLTVCDINGIPRSKDIPADVFERVIKEEGGIGMFSGVYTFGPNSKLFVPEIIKTLGYPDMFLVPAHTSLYNNTWCLSSKKHDQKVLEVISDLHWKDDKTEFFHSPRHTLNRLLAKLAEKGLSIYSAMEYEFTVFEKDEVTPAWEGLHIYSNQIMQNLESPILELRKSLKTAGLPIRSINSEYGNGQMEITIFPKFGIQAPDGAFLFKQAVLETFKQHNFKATFMSKSSENSSTNSGHFNFSIWNSEKTKNLFYDANSEDHLSILAHQFISGIVAHAKALCALLSPTVNCYRRLQPGGFVPYMATWGIESRESFIRAKNESESCTYLEVRASSGLSNPYIVLLGIIAAGFDGMSKNLNIPPYDGNTSNYDRLPTSLEESLDCLENDLELKDIIGNSFIKHYIEFKRTLEVSILEGYDSIEKERELYMTLL